MHKAKAGGRGRLFLLFLALVPCAAHAQYMGSFGINWSNPVSASLSNSMWSNWVVYQTQLNQAKAAAAKGGGNGPAATAATLKIDETALRFRPAADHLLTRKLADQIGHTTSEKQAIGVLLKAIYQEFDAQAARLGKPNDLALALSFFLAQNTAVLRGVPDPKEEQILDLRQVILVAFGQTAGLGSFTDQQRQELYEVLVGYTGLAYAGYLDAKRRGDQPHIKEFQKVAGANLTAITHLPPERFEFSDKGLTIRPQ